MKLATYLESKGYAVRTLEKGTEFDILEIKVPDLRVSLWMTDGLSNYTMPVPEKHQDENFAELYFCMPSYWDLDSSDEKFVWPKLWLQKLGQHLLTKQTWFGHGHTIQCYPDFRSLSASMKSNHFMMVHPILLADVLKDISLDRKKITPLGVLPIFGDEMDYKQAKGTLKLLKRLLNKNLDEKLDDFRESTMTGRMRLFR